MEDPWFTVTELDSKTYAISEYGHWEKVHSFLLLGEEKAALIDTGLGIDSIKRVVDKLTNLPIVVITTHVHADHIGGHGEFEQLFVHEDEEDWLISGIKGLAIEQIRKDIGRDIIISTPDSFDPSTYRPYQGEPSGLLKDKDEIDLGNRILVVYHTPGHSPGHISLFDKQSGYLFTGDLFYDETPIYAFYPTTSPTDLVDSLEKIAAIEDVTKIYGSHNTIGIDPSIFAEVHRAITYLRENDLITFGSGVHEFVGFSVRF